VHRPRTKLPNWAVIVACCAAIACLLALTYGLVFKPNGEVSNTGTIVVGTIVLVAFSGLFGADVVGAVLQRLRGVNDSHKQK